VVMPHNLSGGAEEEQKSRCTGKYSIQISHEYISQTLSQPGICVSLSVVKIHAMNNYMQNTIKSNSYLYNILS
jgi:hypothetical protein